MSRQDSLTPMVKRSVRTIQSELEFLADADYLTQQQLEGILSQLPSASSLRSPPAQNAFQPPQQSFNNLNLSNSNPEQHGYYKPSASPAPIVHSPPAAQQFQPPPAYPSAPAAPSNSLSHAAALYAYSPTDPYDLELKAGDRIAVTEYMNEEWWKGRNERTGKEGIFPRNYVKVEEKLQSPTKETSYGNVPVQVANDSNAMQQGGPQGPQGPSKTQEYGKKFGKKMGNAAIFGAGATIGSNIVNGIF